MTACISLIKCLEKTIGIEEARTHYNCCSWFQKKVGLPVSSHWCPGCSSNQAQSRGKACRGGCCIPTDIIFKKVFVPVCVGRVLGTTTKSFHLCPPELAEVKLGCFLTQNAVFTNNIASPVSNDRQAVSPKKGGSVLRKWGSGQLAFWRRQGLPG